MRINFKKLLLLTSAIVGLWVYRDLSQDVGESYIKIALRKEVPDNFVNPAWFTDGPPKHMEKYDPEEYRKVAEKYRVPGSNLPLCVYDVKVSPESPREIIERCLAYRKELHKSMSLVDWMKPENQLQWELEQELYGNIVADQPKYGHYYQRCCEGKDKCLIEALQRWRALNVADAKKYIEDHTDTSSGYKNVTLPIFVREKHSKDCFIRTAGGFEVYEDRPPIDISKYAKKQDGVSPKPVAEKSKPVQVYAAGYSSPKINVGN